MHSFLTTQAIRFQLELISYSLLWVPFGSVVDVEGVCVRMGDDDDVLGLLLLVLISPICRSMSVALIFGSSC